MAFLSQSTSLRLALIILNTEHRSSKGEARDLFSHLWDEASVRVCADGAANRLHDALSVERRAALRAACIPPAERRSNQLPDVITGDLDSIRPEVLEFYEQIGVPVVREPEQDTHDFEKCLRWLQATHEAAAHEEAYSVVAFGAFGGRLDQQESLTLTLTRTRTRTRTRTLTLTLTLRAARCGGAPPPKPEPKPAPTQGARSRAPLEPSPPPTGESLDAQMANLNMLFRPCYNA